MKKRKVGIWVEHIFQLYSAKPVIDKYKEQGNTVFLITSIADVNLCKEYLKLDDNHIINLKGLQKKWHVIFRMLFEVVLVPEDFSIVYNRLLRKESKKVRLLRKLFFLKLKKENVNKYFIKYKKLLYSLGFQSEFPVDLNLLISYTKVYYAFLVPEKTMHISIMESWDHPMKLPYFIDPDYNMTWNKDLKEDTIHFQNIIRVAQIKPLKFRYIYDRLNVDTNKIFKQIKKDTYIEELKKIDDKKIILYPTTTSSIGIEHEGEMKLIDDICQAVENTDYYLYIKPKPNGPEGDYDFFKKYSRTIIGVYSSDPDSRDMLDESYQAFRYLLLNKSEIVINSGTTFVLEAALMDKKILQLDLEGDRFGSYILFSKTFHLKKYILNNPYTFKYSGDIKALSSEIENTDHRFKDFIKKWITNW